MRWKDGRRSDNIDDLRGEMGPRAAGAAPLILLRLLPLLFRTRGGRVLLVIGLIGYAGARMLGIDPLAGVGTPVPQGGAARSIPPEEQQLAEFVSVVLADTEDSWRAIFAQSGKRYEEPRLVLFRNGVRSACGTASSAVGPFYCPGDRKVYLDLAFFDDLQQRFGAPGDFAQAYVIAHEVGHHVQTLLGVSAQVQQAGAKLDDAGRNRLSVRQELQADCFAGVWGHTANRERQVLEPGDLEEALVAATAIGDDRLQREAQGRVVPDSFTHGSSEQRERWFRRGFDSGDPGVCDTFSAKTL
jgi:predicted metalloprotease